MKKIIIIFLIIGIYSICQAKPWQDYTALGTNPAVGDTILVLDVSDTEDDAAGTLKQLAWVYVQPRDSDLTAVAALTTSSYGLALLEKATEALLKSYINHSKFGVDDTTQGVQHVYGANTATGGKTVWYSPGDDDSNEDSWSYQAQDDEWWCGPASNPDLYIFNSSGVRNPSDSPTISGYHNTDAENVWSIGAVDADVDTANGDTTSRWKTLINNSLVDMISADGKGNSGDGTVPIAKPILPADGIGIPYLVNPSSPVTIDANICKQYFTIAADTTFNLPAEVECGGSGSGFAKEFCFKSRILNADFTLQTATGDSIQVGAIATCTAGNYYLSGANNTAVGDFVCIFGRDNSGGAGDDYWTSLSFDNATGACE